MKAPLIAWLIRKASALRFPYLFGLTAALFVADLFIPDAIPFADELLLGLVTVMLGSWRKRKRDLPTDGSEGGPGGDQK